MIQFIYHDMLKLKHVFKWFADYFKQFVSMSKEWTKIQLHAPQQSKELLASLAI